MDQIKIKQSILKMLLNKGFITQIEYAQALELLLKPVTST